MSGAEQILDLLIEPERLAHDLREVALAEREITQAACCGIDMIWGFADNQNADQSQQILDAEINISVAIVLASHGVRLVDIIPVLKRGIELAKSEPST